MAILVKSIVGKIANIMTRLACLDLSSPIIIDFSYDALVASIANLTRLDLLDSIEATHSATAGHSYEAT